LGDNFAPFGHAAVQVLGEAAEGAKTLDQDKLGEYMHSHSFDTVVGTITYGPDGEWMKARVLVSQFQNLTGNDPGQFEDMTKRVILWAPEYESGNLIWPSTEALK